MGVVAMSDGGQYTDGTDRRGHLWNDGICPVCGDEFIDGFDPLTEGKSYDAKVCIDEKNEETGDGHMLVHLRNVDTDTGRSGGGGDG